MPTTANMNLVMPTEGGDADIWDTILNTLFGLVDAHDHTTGKGVKVPSAGLKINADVSWSFAGTSYAITDAKALDLTPVAASTMTGYSSALFANSSDSNNLYFRNSAGTNVKITDGSTLNISIVGGIGGDYSSIGALLDYDDATDTYRFRQQTSAAVRQFAKISSADVQLFEYKAAGNAVVPTNSVKLKSPAALAASYSVTWPAAVPGAAALVQSAADGTLSFSNTLIGTITATDFNHTATRGLILPASAAIDASGTHARGLGASGAQKRWNIAANTNPVAWPIAIPGGGTIVSYNVYVNKLTAGGLQVSARLYQTKTQGVGMDTETALGAGSSNTANAPGSIALNESGLAILITAGFEYYMVFTGSGNANDQLYTCEIGYTRP